jgi:hypothetical protein
MEVAVPQQFALAYATARMKRIICWSEGVQRGSAPPTDEQQQQQLN